jgi:hypothetical protein
VGPSSIFIGGGKLEKIMAHSYDNVSHGSRGHCALDSNRGSFDPFEKPTIDSGYESIVATDAMFRGLCYPEGSANLINRVFIDEG